jgi:transcriptional regulator with XRE-family HTH domain
MRRHGEDGRLKGAQYARRRREELGLTQADVALAAGVRDVKTIRNLETGRTWPNDLTLRGIETALRIQLGTLDRLAGGGGGTGEIETFGRKFVGGHGTLPTAQELIDLSSAISKLSHVLEATLARGDQITAAKVRSLIDAVSAVMGGYRPALNDAANRVDLTELRQQSDADEPLTE